MPALAVAAAVLAAAVLLSRRAHAATVAATVRTPSPFAYPSYIRGRKVTDAEAGDDGWVRASPADLARRAGVDIYTSTLARILGSDWSSGTAMEKSLIAFMVLNRLRRRQRAYPNAGWTLLKMATHTGDYGDRGLYGSQEHGRYASTARDPTDRDVYVATMVLSGRWPDLTRGADQWFDPESQRKLRAKKPHLYRTPEEMVTRWTANGRQRVYANPPGVSTEKMVMFGPSRAA